MFFLISLSSETFYKTMRMKAFNRDRGIAPAAARQDPDLLRRVRGSFGGRLVLLDWSQGKVLADMACLGVSGFDVTQGTIAAASWIDPSVDLLSEGRPTGRFSHPWFNYLHSVDLTAQQTIVVSSAGSDLIAEFTPDGDVVWSWFGAEHDYAVRPDGLRAFFDRSADYRGLTSNTAEQAMHITSALKISDDRVLATLFHQGTLISIERCSGDARIVLDGLTRPHGIHRRKDGFMLSDTLGHRVLMLDADLNLTQTIPFGSQWLQDTIFTGDETYLALENVHIDQLPQPNLRNRLTEFDAGGRILRTASIGADYRLFTAREIEAAHATALVDAWGRSDHSDVWHWE